MDKFFSSKKKRTTFERSRPSASSNGRSYTQGVSSPKSAKEYKRQLLFLTALTVVLPPIGIICLWRSDLVSLPVRAGATFAAFWLMVFYFGLMIPDETPTVIQPQFRQPQAVTEYSPSSSMYQADETTGEN